MIILCKSLSFSGPSALLQDVLPMVDDQRIPGSVYFLTRIKKPSRSLFFGGVVAGAAIMLVSLVLFETEFLNIVSISFTSLILNELIMVALEITTW